MASLTVENYVKAIYKICMINGHRPATTGQVAAALSVSPGTVTSMLKTLADQALATYTPYEGVHLTEVGRDLALSILRRHRLLELFLVKTLSLDWDEVHGDAEQMEHMISDFLIDRIDDYLGYPRFDPHGDPIPSNDGSLASRHTHPLSECQTGCRFRLARVLDQSPAFLQYLSRAGLALGAEGEVVANQPEVGIVTVQAGGQDTTLGRQAATALLVTAEPESLCCLSGAVGGRVES